MGSPAMPSGHGRYHQQDIRAGLNRAQAKQPESDANYVMSDLEFETTSQADALLAALRDHWRGLEGIAFPEGTHPQARADVVDTKDY